MCPHHDPLTRGEGKLRAELSAGTFIEIVSGMSYYEGFISGHSGGLLGGFNKVESNNE